VRDEDERITHPLSGDAVGFITYAPDGHMAVQFRRANRALLAVGDWAGATPAEIAAAARDYFACCGTTRLRDGEVVHRVELSLMPNWIGRELVRLVGFDGRPVSLSTPPTLVGGSKSPPWYGADVRVPAWQHL
jgi:Lipocalin-like domain